MATMTLDTVLAQARQLPPREQARLIEALTPMAQLDAEPVASLTGEDDDEAEQRETWAYLQRALDEDRLGVRPLFPSPTETP
jgi:hypothetical protein